jgi:hypothetical protein
MTMWTLSFGAAVGCNFSAAFPSGVCDKFAATTTETTTAAEIYASTVRTHLASMVKVARIQVIIIIIILKYTRQYLVSGS